MVSGAGWLLELNESLEAVNHPLIDIFISSAILHDNCAARVHNRFVCLRVPCVSVVARSYWKAVDVIVWFVVVSEAFSANIPSDYWHFTE